MSKISLAPDASGTGIFTIASPGTSTNRTLTLPDDTGTIVTNSGNQAGSFTTLNTSGQVVFNDAGADVDFRVEGDTEANLLFVDASTNRIGIGTNAPQSVLHLLSATNTTQLSISNTNTSVQPNDIVGAIGFKVIDNNRGTPDTDFAFIRTLATEAHIATKAGTALTFGTTPNESLVVAEHMRIDDSGNVGIGTSSPSTVLNVKKDQSATTSIKVENPNAGTGAVTTFQAVADVASLAIGVDSSTKTGTLLGLNRTSLASIVSFSDSALGVGTFGATPLVFGTGNTERIRITSAGEVLINETTPILDTTGSLVIQKSSGPSINLFRDDTTISSGNAFGSIGFYGKDTTSNTPTQHAYIQALASGTHAAGDNPTDLVFGTTADGSETVAEKMRLNQAGNLLFNSGYGSVATAYGCRAWVNFNGTSTVAIRASGNVSSITDNGTGDYTVNFTTAMPDANYSVSGSTEYRTCFMTNDDTTPRTTTAVRLKNSGFSGSSVVGPTDKAYVSVAIFR